MTLNIVDLFCGAGGMTAGILAAARRRRLPVRFTAVNHWDTAINSHSLNHPNVHHICEPVENLIPAKVVPGRRLHLLAAGCECTFHSNARGGGPCNEQSRSQAWQIIRWATDITVENIQMENVREFMDWGPLHPTTHRPIPKRKGEYFRSFITALRGLGYNVEWRIQCAADFGDPTSRRRFLLLARRNGGEITWPQPTHCDPAALSAASGKRLKPWRTAREIIDWSLKGQSVFGRKKPLCANTMARIVAGLKKFGGPNAEPFLVILRGTSPAHIASSHASLDEPISTLTTTGKAHYLVEPFVIGQQSGAAPRSTASPLPTVAQAGAIRLVEPFLSAYHAGKTRSKNRIHSVDAPVPTLDTSNRFALCEPIITQTDQTGGNGTYCQSVDRPLGTVVSKQNRLLVQPIIAKFYGTGVCQPVGEPLDTVTTRDRFMLVEFPVKPTRTQTARTGKVVGELDILTRMLQPHELAKAHSLDGFQLTGTKEDQTAQIGNSVPKQLAAAHAYQLLKAYS